MITTREHELKTWPEFYERIISGEKSFEVRYDDRGFAVGDVLLLREWSPEAEAYSGRESRYVVTYLLRDGFGLFSRYVVMSIRPASPPEREKKEP